MGKGIGNKAINGPWRGRPKRRRSHKLVPDMSRHCGGVLSQQRIASPFLRGTEKETESGSESRSVIATPWTIQSMEFSRPGYWMGSHSLLQGIFPSQGSNPGLPHCRWILFQLSRQGRVTHSG